MLIGVVVSILAILPPVIVSSWALLWFLGHPNAKLLILAPVPKLSIVPSPMPLIRHPGSVLLVDLRYPPSRATIVYCDNISAVYLLANPVHHQRTKHIEIVIHFVHDHVALGLVRVLYVLSRFQL